jgi:succinyl-CoA synthetase alpha subunit
MPIQIKIVTGKYFDSVSLMLAARTLRSADGVEDAAIVMATEQNKHILESSGFVTPEVMAAEENAVVVAVRACDDAACSRAIAEGLALLEKRRSSEGETNGARRPRTLAGALKIQPKSNLALISLPGKYAAGAARDALEQGLNVMLFSDNVSVADEVELKTMASKRNLLVMGPDCGTAIVNGVPLAFANAVRRGNVGIVGASGTGLQEVTVLLDAAGVGVSQAIGTGGRDLKKAVGGLSFLKGIEFLLQDKGTDVVVLVSKPPEAEVLAKVAAALRGATKPVVSIFLGAGGNLLAEAKVHETATLEEAAVVAAALAKGDDPVKAIAVVQSAQRERAAKAATLSKSLGPTQRWVRGLFCGGTLAAEAELILTRAGLSVHSNFSKNEALQLPDPWQSVGHTLVDLGDDVFTVGRPHPMIDDSLRNQRLVREAADSEVGVILFDVVIGYGSNLEPLKDLAPALEAARAKVKRDGRQILFVCSVTGTDADPQHRSTIVERLSALDVHVFSSNAAASRFAAEIVRTREAS